MIKKCCLIALLMSSEMTLALSWQDFWLRPDQQGQKLLEQKQYQAAADRFENGEWQGTAHYRAGHFEKAAQKFSQDQTARGYYNYGNALAQQGKLADALKAYDRALEQRPNFQDAQFNRKLVEEALKNQSENKSQEQKEQQQQQNQSQQSQSNQDKQSDNKQDKQSGSNQQQDPSKGAEASEAKNAQNQQSEDQQASKDKPSEKNEASAKNVPSEGSPEKTEENKDKNEQNADLNNQASKSSDSKQKEEEHKKPISAENGDSLEKGQEKNDTALAAQELSDEQKKNTDLQQWLQKIPDDPAGLLRRKFLRDHERRLGMDPISNDRRSGL